MLNTADVNDFKGLYKVWHKWIFQLMYSVPVPPFSVPLLVSSTVGERKPLNDMKTPLTPTHTVCLTVCSWSLHARSTTCFAESAMLLLLLLHVTGIAARGKRACLVLENQRIGASENRVSCMHSSLYTPLILPCLISWSVVLYLCTMLWSDCRLWG